MRLNQENTPNAASQAVRPAAPAEVGVGVVGGASPRPATWWTP